MLKKIMLKLCQLFLLMLAVTVIAFILVDLSPMDPIIQFSMRQGTGLNDEQKAKLIEKWGLNKPLLERYIAWFRNMMKGEWGYSNVYQRPVLQIISEGAGASLLLMGVSWLLQGILGFFLGLLAGIKQGRWVDRVIKTFAIIISSTPTYWIAILLILFFSIYLNWFPVGFGSPIGLEQSNVTFLDRIYYAILPALTLTLVGTGNIILHTRAKVVEIMTQDFILYQQSRGYQGWSLMTKAAMRNVMLPAITLQFMTFSEMFSGTILAEKAFNYQGLGKYSVDAGIQGDVPLLLGIVVFSTLFVFIGNQLADLLGFLVDYRTRRGKLI